MSIDKTKFENFVAFIKKSFEEVINELVDTTYEEISSKEIDSEEKVALVIGIAGNSKGRILLISSKETADTFAVAMNCDDPLDDPKDMYIYMAEFSNMFCGRATTFANNEYKDREFWLTPPGIFSAKNLEISTPSIQSEIAVYKGKHGLFLVDIGFES